MAETTLHQVLSSLYTTDTLLNQKFSDAISGILTGIVASPNEFKFPLDVSILDEDQKIRITYIPKDEIISGKLDKFDDSVSSGLIVLTGPSGSIMSSCIELGGETETEWSQLTAGIQANVNNIVENPQQFFG